MADQDASLLSHVSVGSNRFEQAVAFYDAVLATLGAQQLLAHDGAVAWGRQVPEFWVHTPIDGQPATLGNGTHVGFLAASRAEVDAFHAAALAAGARDEGAPGPRPHYGEPYYGCFVRDLDGHKVEAMCWQPGPADA